MRGGGQFCAQTKMLEKGYAAGEEDMDDMIFGDHTQSALLTLQARKFWG